MDINIQQDINGPVGETVRAAWTLDAGVLTITENDEGTIVVFTLETD